MAHRKEVFESKVLQKLYPAAPKLEKEPSPPRFVETLAKKNYVKRTAPQEDTAADAGKTQSAANLGRRMYTVLPPPPDYKTDLEKSVTLPQLQSVNSAEDPAEESVHDSNEDQDKEEGEEEEGYKRRRRRRKRKPSLHQDSGKDGAAPESTSGQSQMHVDERGECVSKNRKRKLKKKRHKEKLLSMGLMPRAAALEFTYRKDGQEEEGEGEEDNKRRAAEVSDFLRTTKEIYMSDSSSGAGRLPLLSGVVDELLSSIAGGREPAAVLKQLYALKAFVRRKQTDELEKALEELHDTSSLSADETTAVVSLFRYWITDIFPMQGEKKTRLSTVHV